MNPASKEKIVIGWQAELRLREDVLHLAEDGSALRLVLHLCDALKFLKQFALSFGEFSRRLHPNFDKQNPFAVAVQHGNAFAAQLEYGSRLRAFGDFQRLFSLKRWDLYFRADRGLSEGDRNHAVQIITLPIKEGMLLHTQHQVQISGRAAVDAGFSDSGEANAGTVFHSGGDFGVNGFLLHNAAFAAAIRAGVADYAARPMTIWTSTRNAEKALLISDLPATAAGPATGGSFALRAP